MKFTGELPSIEPSKRPLYTNSPVTQENGHWDFPEKMGGKNVGFIYVIYDTVLNRAYLGKKQFYGAGKLNNGQESNWKKYTSSSKLLNELLKARPKDEFEFICLEQYTTKGTLSYSETWSLCLVEAPTSKLWYNTLIEKVTWPVREQISCRHKERLNNIISRIANA